MIITYKFYLYTLLIASILTWRQSIAEEITSTGVSFSVSDTIAPYFYSEQPGGIQYELLKHALRTDNMHMSRVELAPNRRALRLTLLRKTDCLINAPEGISGLHYTRSLNEYQNSIFTLESSQLDIASIEDLSNIS